MDALNQIFPILLFVALIIFVVTILKGLSQTKTSMYGYSQRDALFSNAEIVFLKALMKATEDKYLVFGKVRVADVLLPEKGLNRSHWQTAFNKIAMKHFDFILCDPVTMQVICAVELDDSSHKRRKTQQRDLFINEACERARLKLIRVVAKREYSVQELKEAVG